MKMQMLALAGSLLLLGACKSPSGPAERSASDPSSVSFSYQGHGLEGRVSGSYQVLADPDPSRPMAGQTFALGQRIAQAGAFRAQSNQLRTTAVSDRIVLTVPRLNEGSVALDRFCEADYCPEILIALELKNTHGSQARYSCTLEEGTIRVTSITAQRAQGEFSGSGSCVGGPGTADLEQFSVSYGRFDVKLRVVQS